MSDDPLIPGKVRLKNREAGFGPASNRLAETFSLNRLLSSPQQPSAVALHSTNNFKMVNPRKLAKPLHEIVPKPETII